MEKKDFLECKKEIVAILEKYGADYKDAPCVVVSAINEILATTDYVASVTLIPSMNILERPQLPKHINLRIADNSNTTDFVESLRQVFQAELRNVETATQGR